MRVCSVSVCASLSGTRGELGDRCFMVWVMSVMLARMWSTEEALGMGVFVGNHVRVSQMHWACVLVAHTM